MPSIEPLNGKPFYLKVDGKQRKIGEIDDAMISNGRTKLSVIVKMTDEEAAGILGAAQDKAEAAESPIGMSEAEIKEILSREPDGPRIRPGIPLPNDFEGGVR